MFTLPYDGKQSANNICPVSSSKNQIIPEATSLWSVAVKAYIPYIPVNLNFYPKEAENRRAANALWTVSG
jgi:hypothetical protein